MDAVIIKQQHMILKEFTQPKLSDIESLRHILSLHPCGFYQCHALSRVDPEKSLRCPTHLHQLWKSAAGCSYEGVDKGKYAYLAACE
jgi:hypothetical protein